ncbi:hypothetical protein BDW42DRAFT_174998 [Aspergillus taichungensis]|uniref:Uncharacterized protein n=1 Tax=Aspergillus taichungensis TaxID=482145 RepID=A0A2J5HMI3_9EURO|nr:hypothetical protein BDW42DRAFT_174998 [Aspergillus taichungensis]
MGSGGIPRSTPDEVGGLFGRGYRLSYRGPGWWLGMVGSGFLTGAVVGSVHVVVNIKGP